MRQTRIVQQTRCNRQVCIRAILFGGLVNRTVAKPAKYLEDKLVQTFIASQIRVHLSEKFALQFYCHRRL